MALTRLNNQALPTGSVLQVKSDILTGAVSTSGTTFVDTGLSVDITPRSTSSKFLIIVNLGLVGVNTSDGIMTKLLRDSTEIASATGADTRNVFTQSYYNEANNYIGTSNHFFDTPSASSQITYKLQFAMTGSTNTGYINRRNSDNFARTSSNFTVMEIAG
jgi:hypothetical protein